MGTLRLDVGEGSLRAEHERLLRTALRRGDKDPEGHLGDGLEGTYPERVRAIAERTWRQRMVHEHASAAVFSGLLPQLMAAGAPLEFKTTVLRASMDELRHASLCAGVVRLLGGVPEAQAELRQPSMPAHKGCSPREVAFRNVLFVGCLSETTSVALLTEERERTREPAILRVVDQLAADEVLHAKLGWSYLAYALPDLDADERARLPTFLRAAFAYVEGKMLGAMPVGLSLSDEEHAQLAALGVQTGEEGRQLFYATAREVVVPRLEDHGLPARAAFQERHGDR